MSKQPWWERMGAYFFGARVVARPPAPKRPSPQAEARREGWSQESAGSWSHEQYGVVERTRAGTWEAYTNHYDKGGFATMREAMGYARNEWLTALAGTVADTFIARIADPPAADVAAQDPLPHRTETLEIDGAPREVHLYGFGGVAAAPDGRSA